MATLESAFRGGQNISQFLQILAATLTRNQQLGQIDQARQGATSQFQVGSDPIDFSRPNMGGGVRSVAPGMPQESILNQPSPFPMENQLDRAKFLQSLLQMVGNPEAERQIGIQSKFLPQYGSLSGPRGQITEVRQDPLGAPPQYKEVRPGENPLIERARQELGTPNLTPESRDALNKFLSSGGQGQFPAVQTEQRVPSENFDDPQDGMRYKVIRNPYTGEEIRREKVGPTPPTADMRNKASARVLVKNSIDAVKDLSRKIITKVGPAQRIDAIERGAQAVFGNDADFRTYQDARMALAGNLAVAQQGSRPSDADIQAIWLPLVPDPYRDTQESMELKWTLIETMSSPERKEKGGNPKGGGGKPKIKVW